MPTEFRKRDIEKILHFRSDVSPFLVHLTRSHDGMEAKDSLRAIINDKVLRPGRAMSNAKFAVKLGELTEEEQRKYFGFISFTETPLHELHCLFDIHSRKVDLKPYGLVFLKDRLKRKGVSPVFYVNNTGGDKDAVVRALATTIKTCPKAAAQILPLVAIFGKKLKPVEGEAPWPNDLDFTWEREWRLPYSNDMLQFTKDDVFIGLCPESEISEFQNLFGVSVPFIDPNLNLERDAPKLVRRRKRLRLKHSVV